jgi:hypothetical protein
VFCCVASLAIDSRQGFVQLQITHALKLHPRTQQTEKEEKACINVA